jgi:hypothetical protein
MISPSASTIAFGAASLGVSFLAGFLIGGSPGFQPRESSRGQLSRHLNFNSYRDIPGYRTSSSEGCEKEAKKILRDCTHGEECALCWTCMGRIGDGGRMAKTKGRRTVAPRTSPARVEVKIDRALKQRWEAAAATLERAKSSGASAFDVLWETVGEVLEHEPPLYLAAGLSTAKDFLAKYTHESERNAKRFVRVARYASPNEEERYGISKLDAVIDYVEAKLGTPAKGRVPVDFATLRIPVKREDETQRLSVEEASVEEIRAATRALAKTPKAKQSPAVAAVRSALPAALQKELTISIAKERLTIGRIPLARLRETALALAKAKLP